MPVGAPLSPTEEARIRCAEALARRAHAGQTYNDRSYADGHLSAVARLLAAHGAGGALIAAGWLHDSLEDTGLDRAEIATACGPEVLALVEAVTDAPGRNRAERHRLTLPKIQAVGSAAILLKLCDRMVNAGSCAATGDTRLGMYRREHPAFRAALYDRAAATDPLRPAILAIQARLDALLDPPDPGRQ